MTYPIQPIEEKIEQAIENRRPVVLSIKDAERVCTALTCLRNQSGDPKMEQIRRAYNRAIDYYYKTTADNQLPNPHRIVDLLEGHDTV